MHVKLVEDISSECIWYFWQFRLSCWKWSEIYLVWFENLMWQVKIGEMCTLRHSPSMWLFIFFFEFSLFHVVSDQMPTWKVVIVGLEPTTLGLLDPRSSQLSYTTWGAAMHLDYWDKEEYRHCEGGRGLRGQETLFPSGLIDCEVNEHGYFET